MLQRDFKFNKVLEDLNQSVLTAGKIPLSGSLIHKLIKCLFEKKLYSSSVKVLEFVWIQRLILTE